MRLPPVMPGDKVVAFANGTFSGIDALTLRIKAATREELAADALDPKAASVAVIEVPHGQSVTGDLVEGSACRGRKPKWAFMAHWEDRFRPHQRYSRVLGRLPNGTG
ncbi:hypothetical protein OKA06_20030 [Novosphingobium sp. MW5]|nr:hypothetical protein [Novosphingobium sp. MW5]